MALWRYNDKKKKKKKKRSLDFVQTCGLILLVNDNHVDNNIKESLVYFTKARL